MMSFTQNNINVSLCLYGLDSCSQCFTLHILYFYNPTFFHVIFAIYSPRVAKVYFSAPLMWDLAILIVLSNEMLAEVKVGQLKAKALRGIMCLYSHSLMLLSLTIRNTCPRELLVQKVWKEEWISLRLEPRTAEFHTNCSIPADLWRWTQTL